MGCELVPSDSESSGIVGTLYFDEDGSLSFQVEEVDASGVVVDSLESWSGTYHLAFSQEGSILNSLFVDLGLEWWVDENGVGPELQNIKANYRLETQNPPWEFGLHLVQGDPFYHYKEDNTAYAFESGIFFLPRPLR